MSPEEIQFQRKAIAEKYGAWTNHNIQLSQQPPLYTISDQPTGADYKLKRYTQIISDHLIGSGRTWQDLRILDLACLEGIYGIEMALQGAQVVGIEGREANLAKARFVKETLQLDNLEFFEDDVRHLSPAKYGRFDVVICVGILYHLDVPDLFQFLSQIHAVCKYLAIIDTQVAIAPEQQVIFQDQSYWGKSFLEHEENASQTQKLDKLWASLDNSHSFWLTRPSLLSFLDRLGFTSIYECHHPAVKRYEVMRTQEYQDRATFIAIKGHPVKILASPLANQLADSTWQEIEQLRISPSQK